MEKYWPKTSNTYECKFCQYWSSCWKAKRPALTTIIDGKHEESPFSVSKATTINVKPVQAEFKYKGTRKKAITQKEKDRLEREKYEKLMLMKKNSNPS